MEDLRKNVASSTESAGNRMELSKETIIDFEKRNTKVLIADDDDNIRGLIDEILKTEHVPTTVCSSGLEALDLIKREDFGIIISDIKIRDFDGMGLLKAAKVINPNSDVIIITGYPTVETAVTAMRFGAAEYFTKPFGVEQLRKSVNRLIEKRILDRKLKVEKHQMEVQRFDEETGLFTNRYFHLLLVARNHPVGAFQSHLRIAPDADWRLEDTAGNRGGCGGFERRQCDEIHFSPAPLLLPTNRFHFPLCLR